MDVDNSQRSLSPLILLTGAGWSGGMLGFQVELSRCLTVTVTLSILRQVEGSEAVATVRPIDTMQVKNRVRDNQ